MFRPMRKKCVLEMEELPGEKDGLILPDKSRRRIGFDRGKVIAETGTDLVVGEWVYMRQDVGGLRIKDGDFNGVRRNEQLRFVKSPWWKYIPIKEENMQATGHNIVLIADEKIEKRGEIYLPDKEHARPGTGVIHSIGRDVTEDLKVGDKVVYSITNCRNIASNGIDYRSLEEKDIYCVIE